MGNTNLKASDLDPDNFQGKPLLSHFLLADLCSARGYLSRQSVFLKALCKCF